MFEPKELGSAVPDDTQHPVMYERTTLYLAIVIVLGIVAITGLSAFERATGEVVTGIVGVIMVCAGALARMFEPRKG